MSESMDWESYAEDDSQIHGLPPRITVPTGYSSSPIVPASTVANPRTNFIAPCTRGCIQSLEATCDPFYEIEVAVAGMNYTDIKVTLADKHILIIKAKGSLITKVVLPHDADPAAIVASCQYGLLSLRISKLQNPGPMTLDDITVHPPSEIGGRRG